MLRCLRYIALYCFGSQFCVTAVVQLPVNKPVLIWGPISGMESNSDREDELESILLYTRIVYQEEEM